MINFDFCSPTRFLFGRGVEEKAGECLKDAGATCVMIQYGGGSVQRSGLLQRVLASIDRCGIRHVEMGGVQPNPRLSFVRKAIELGRAQKVDFLLAVGGGSAIDSCKATAVGLANPDADVWDFYRAALPVPVKVLPVGTVLTLPAAGSEGSNSSVITNEENNLKRGLTAQATRPAFSLLNPELCFTLPAEQLGNGVADILAHIIERYFTSTPEGDLIDRMAEAVMTGAIAAAKLLQKNMSDYDAWSQLMWASMLAHNDSLGVGRTQDWASHNIEHELSGEYDVAHGAGLAVVMPAWMRYIYASDVPRFVRFAVCVMGVSPDPFHPERVALEGIDRYEAFLAALGLATRLSGLGIGPEKLQLMTSRMKLRNADGTAGDIRHLTREDCCAILQSAL